MIILKIGHLYTVNTADKMHVLEIYSLFHTKHYITFPSIYRPLLKAGCLQIHLYYASMVTQESMLLYTTAFQVVI